NQDSPSPYFIKSRNSAGYEPYSDICKTQSQIQWCNGVGWTYIGAVDISNSPDDGGYESELWTTKGINQTLFNSQFWSANVTEVCLTSVIFNIQIPVEAPSLRSLFFEKKILNMTSQQWVDSIAPLWDDTISTPNFTAGCFEIGFNVGDEGGAAPRARLGILSTHRAGTHNKNDSFRNP
ncbi:Hypothetical predicted protein, partial [Paramuricea clavata]